MSDTPDEPTAPFPHASGGALSPGDVLGGRYELRTVLGRGGMATVWRAHDPVLHRDVAVKVFQHASALPDAADRAAAEVRMLANLNHPHLVSVYDAAGTTPGSFDHLVMELVEGRSLRERLDAGPLAPAEVATLGAELAAGLEHVHERGIVHRDLKPANVLLETTSRGVRAKIADFGVARMLEGVALTMAGTTVGTANYLSPEQATGADAGPPSDIYSLGLVLLECLTGVLAYPGHGVGAAAARLHRPPHIPASLGPAWTGLLAAMTALDPATRPDAVQVAARLRQIADGSPSTVVLPATATEVLGNARPVPGGTAVLPTTEPRRRRRGLLVVIGLVAAAIVGLGLLVGFGGGDEGDGGPGSTPSTTAPARTSAPPSTSAPASTAPATTARPSTPTPTTSARRTSSTPSGPQAPVPPGQDKPGKDDPGKDKKPNPGKGNGKP